MNEKHKCIECGKEFDYNEIEDSRFNDTISINGRKVIIDDNKQCVPFYALPPDKRKLVNKKFIKIMCGRCLSKH